MKRGLIVYDRRVGHWAIWIGQTRYWLQECYPFELRIAERYYSAWLDRSDECFVLLDNEVAFILHIDEVYKIRIELSPYLSMTAPF